MARQARPLDEVLSRLHGVRQTGKRWSARCPTHEDRQSSLSIATGEDGQVLLKCFAGCTAEAIVAALGLEMRDLFPDDSRRRRGGGGRMWHGAAATAQPTPGEGLTLAGYAEAKQLPVAFLQSLGVSQIHLGGRPAVRISYMNKQSKEVAVRFRLALDGDERFRWRKRSKPCLYGLQRIEQARAAGYAVLCEGESDTQTLWLHQIPAIGLPGASMWRGEWAAHLNGIGTIYIVVEPDRGGQVTQEWMGRSQLRDRVRVVHLGEHKDPSGLYLDDPAAFRSRFAGALQAAVPWSEHAGQAQAEHARWAWALCEPLAQELTILDRFARELEDSGVAGESRVAKLLYLTATSRLLDRPVSVAVKGPSSAGKSFLVERVLAYFPSRAYYALSAMSERALAYSEEPLSHRILVIYEAAGLQGEVAGYLVRSLLSEGHVRYETVEKTTAGLRPRLIEREGPTGLIVTTTAVHLHPEIETRLLSVTVTDTPEQTRSILVALAQGDRPKQELTEWHALQEWLEGGEHRGVIPFAEALAEAVPPVAVRLRRDFGAVLGLIRAHALLHRASRSRDERGRIVATLGDYAVVRTIVADLVADGAEATVAPSLRETVKAVAELLGDGRESVTVVAVGSRLGLDKSSASRRVRAAISRGYLKNLETGKGKPSQLTLGEPLPEEMALLPRPETLAGCAVAAVTRETQPPPPTAGAGDGLAQVSGCPTCGDDTLWSHVDGGG